MYVLKHKEGKIVGATEVDYLIDFCPKGIQPISNTFLNIL